MPTAHDRLPLGALRVFEAVATHLSFSDAAEALEELEHLLFEFKEQEESGRV